jgi:hypothetical protein
VKVNIYLPDDLGAKVKAADLKVSAICQAALAPALASSLSPEPGRLRGPQVRGRSCIYCGSEDRRRLVLEFWGPKQLTMMRCSPTCNVEEAERQQH